MKKKRKIIQFTIYIIFLMASNYFITGYIELQQEMNRQLRFTFLDFQYALEELNQEIAEIMLSSENLDRFIYNKEILDRKKLYIFEDTNWKSFRKHKKAIKESYLDDVLIDANKNIYQILKDEHISNRERKYLNTLFSFNKKLIQLQNEFLESFGSYSNRKYYKGDIFVSFSEKADEILKEDKYTILKVYKDELENKNVVSVEEVREISKKIMAKLGLGDVELSFDSKRQDDSNKYVFNKYTTTELLSNEGVPYEVTYNKLNNTVYVLLRIQNNPNIEHSKEKMEQIANEIVKNFNDGSYVNYKKTIYYSGDKLETIIYDYIKKINDIYDETKRFSMRINKYGKLSSFEIGNVLDDKEIPIPKVTKDEIISKYKGEYPIKDCILIRNIDGHLEYEAHVNFNGETYSIVYDAITGKKKYISPKVRNYGHFSEEIISRE
ncbi:hypothetical protein [Thermohalobacter berrensis]|uniref:PepSY domain-containing protein n=1 Tax=Thermohalobacter berrensis TaxID=99594 RepID=A0A419SWA9_9FIRM|nr:hypothetical protein [Thermohalobacter berrensis]RKD29491.1 hypothetical protein BET03_05375 [Thermohalobacter berrensis]